MHDIKYFFSTKLIRQFRRTQKKFQGEGTNYRKYYKKTLFFKIQGGTCPPLDHIGSAPGSNDS
jgi:hypothetical protein